MSNKSPGWFFLKTVLKCGKEQSTALVHARLQRNSDISNTAKCTINTIVEIFRF